MATLEVVDKSNWQEFVQSPLAVLMLGKTDCEACAEWTTELETYLANTPDVGPVRFGKMLVDKPGLVDFKRASPWLAQVDVLPYNVIYQNGEKAKEFAGGGLSRLTARLEKLTP